VQHFYNTQLFHNPLDAYEEELSTELDMRWFDNTGVIQLLSEHNIGVISLLHKQTQYGELNAGKSLVRKLERHHAASDS